MTSPFEVTDINIFSSWVFNLPKNKECTICRCSLNGPSLYNQEKGIDSYVVNGVCEHSFHYECIKSWTDKNKYCPNCIQSWQYQQLPFDLIQQLPPSDLTQQLPPTDIIQKSPNNLIEEIKNIDKKINIINENNKKNYKY